MAAAANVMATTSARHEFMMARAPEPSRGVGYSTGWLQNDLDLIVRMGASERHGNQPANAVAFDRTNNVEQVIWEQPPAGSVDIVVRAFRAAQFRQKYALVARAL